MPLSEAAGNVLAAVPVIGRRGIVFTTDGKTHFSGFSKTKRAFVEVVLEELIETYETKVGPHNGAKVVAKAWTDPDYKARLRRGQRFLRTRGDRRSLTGHGGCAQHRGIDDAWGAGRQHRMTGIYFDAGPRARAKPRSLRVRKNPISCSVPAGANPP